MLKKIIVLGAILMFVAMPVAAQETPADLGLDETLQLDSGEPVEFEEPVKAGEMPPDQFYRAKVLKILNQELVETGSSSVTTQKLLVKFTNGDLKDQEMELINDGIFTINGGKGLNEGQTILVYKTSASGQVEFYIADTYRVPALVYMLAAFLLLAVVLSRWKGVASIAGLALSVVVIAKFVVPQIIAGKNPLVIILLGALMIAFVSIYLAHGFNRRTTVALVSTLLTMGLAAGLAVWFVSMGHLFGLGSEEAFYVQQLGVLQNLNLRGLLLGGIILGALGVLDDITTAQTATIYEIKRANMALGPQELFKRGLRVGREHVNSLVNTLFLAYAGASLPMFLFFTVGGSSQPIWVTLNSEFIAEEVVRTLVGSMALMLAVPLTTFLAAMYFGKMPIEKFQTSAGELPDPVGHTHEH